MEEDYLYILVIGNPVDGFGYIGPFEDSEDAVSYADKHLDDRSDWWISSMEKPEPVIVHVKMEGPGNE